MQHVDVNQNNVNVCGHVHQRQRSLVVRQRVVNQAAWLRYESKTSSSVQGPRRDGTRHHRHTPEVEEEAREKERKERASEQLSSIYMV